MDLIQEHNGEQWTVRITEDLGENGEVLGNTIELAECCMENGWAIDTLEMESSYEGDMFDSEDALIRYYPTLDEAKESFIIIADEYGIKEE